MKKFYRKSELGFAILWIGAYCVLMSVGDGLSQSLGVEKCVTLPVALILSSVLLVFIKKNGLSEKYGLCKPCVSASGVLYYVPLLLLMTVNVWHGFEIKLSVAETLLYIFTMLCVGFLEEVIFRGLLFNAMLKDNFKAAVIVSSVTFGMGHIINLFNGSGAELLPNILQVIYAAAAGFMLVMLYLRTESLIVPIVFHGVFNALSVFSDEGAITVRDRIVSCVFLVAVSGFYAVYLAFSGRREKVKQMKIRPANEKDVKSIASLYVHNHRTTYKNLLPAEYFKTLTLDYAKDKWTDYIADESSRVWIAEDESGFLGFAASALDEELPDVWYLDSLHVCEKARGKGVGTSLIKTVGKYALDNGYEKMSICIVKGNNNAGSLYRKLGARHYKDFTGKMSRSEKLLWDDLKTFK